LVNFFRTNKKKKKKEMEKGELKHKRK